METISIKENGITLTFSLNIVTVTDDISQTGSVSLSFNKSSIGPEADTEVKVTVTLNYNTGAIEILRILPPQTDAHLVCAIKCGVKSAAKSLWSCWRFRQDWDQFKNCVLSISSEIMPDAVSCLAGCLVA